MSVLRRGTQIYLIERFGGSGSDKCHGACYLRCGKIKMNLEHSAD
jgi:hypothetical protein